MTSGLHPVVDARLKICSDFLFEDQIHFRNSFFDTKNPAFMSRLVQGNKPVIKEIKW